MDKRAEKYFSHYGEPELLQLAPGFKARSQVFDVVTVIPLRSEPNDALNRLLRSLELSASTAKLHLLIIFIVNAREGDPDSVFTENQCTLAWFDQKGGSFDFVSKLDPHTTVYQCTSFCTALVLDRTSPGRRLPARQGVGLARKIGNDLAAILIKVGLVRHPVFGNTDGDAAVPSDYAARLMELDARAAGAWVYPFRHVPGGDAHIDQQTALYERYLRYYAQQLTQAGSPYGFVSLGSVICMDVERYIAVRGHPKRLAGEDFYILNKIKKIAPVITLSGPPIELISRISDRVPFGTGQAVDVMVKRLPGEPYMVYDPRSFLVLHTFLETCKVAIHRGEAKPPMTPFGDGIDSETEAKLRQLIGLDSLWPKLFHADRNERLQRFHAIFDGLRTLQLVHHLRDLVWPPAPIDEALRSAAKNWHERNKL